MKNKKSWRGLLIIVLLLAIGFAAVTTTLFINGTINFGANAKDFEDNLKFTAAKLEYSDSTKTAKVHGTDGVELINSTGKTITFTVDPLTLIGETATLTYEIKNLSQYDASLKEISCTVKTDETTPVDVTDAVVKNKTGDYIKLETSNTTGTLAARTGVKSDNTITITMIKSYAGTDTSNEKAYNVTCKIDADALPAAAAPTSSTTSTEAAGA